MKCEDLTPGDDVRRALGEWSADGTPRFVRMSTFQSNDGQLKYPAPADLNPIRTLSALPNRQPGGLITCWIYRKRTGFTS